MMKKKKLWSDTHGAVTIIVSIMLIPAILLSGTAVDLARIHTAKSIAHNANQLAANSVLTEYNALLKDLYGLFAVEEDDPVLAEMINEYIQVAVFGEEPDNAWIDTGLGSYQLFKGSSASGEIEAVENYNLGNKDVLRRQIEEYMKIRGPVILIERLLNALTEQGGSLKASNDAIEQQQKVDVKISELFKLYGDLYNAILKADKCVDVGAGANVASAVGTVSSSLSNIKAAFADLRSRYARWDSVNGHIKNQTQIIEQERNKSEPDLTKIAIAENRLEMYEKQREEVEKSFQAKLNHIAALANGGSWQDWTVGRWQEKKDIEGNKIKFEDGTPELEWISGYNISGGSSQGLRQTINNAQATANSFKAKFTNVVTAAKAIDNKREEIRAEISILEQKINDPNCDPTVRTELREQIRICNELLDRFPNIENLAKAYQTSGDNYIDNQVKSMFEGMLNGVVYRDKNNPGQGLTIAELGGIASDNRFKLAESIRADNSEAARYTRFDVTYEVPPGFKKFREIDSNPNGNQGLYDELQKMANASSNFTPISIDGLTDNSGSSDPETRQRNILNQLIQLANEAKDGLVNNPQGARRIEGSGVSSGSMGSFSTSAAIDLISDPGNAIQEMADWALMMTYDVSMFSNYTTAKPSQLSQSGTIKDTPKETSLTNVPMDPNVNYFYQSEWEYLLVGSTNTDTNLNKVKDLIYAIRLVCNTIIAFTIPEIKTLATTIKSAVSAIPYIGPALGVILYFATFGAFAAAESAVDLATLRNGCKVPLMKNKESWILRPSGIVSELQKRTAGGGAEATDNHKKEGGISYEQYMMVFFLLTANTNTLAARTGHLVEWNVINYKSKANANNMNDKGFVKTNSAVNTMKAEFAKPDCFRLRRMHTDFNITTTIDLRLFFLNMPFFERQGSPFSNTFPVVAVDSRGY